MNTLDGFLIVVGLLLLLPVLSLGGGGPLVAKGDIKPDLSKFKINSAGQISLR